MAAAVLVGAIVSKRVRSIVVSASWVPALICDRARERPPIEAVPWVALRLLDDAAYGAGVWVGCLREGSFEALVPDLTSWPNPPATSPAKPPTDPVPPEQSLETCLQDTKPSKRLAGAGEFEVLVSWGYQNLETSGRRGQGRAISRGGASRLTRSG